MLCRRTDAVLVLRADPEDILLQRNELAGLEGGVFHRGRQLHPLFFLRQATLHNVVGDGRATIVPGGVPCHEARLVSDLGDIEGGRWARFVWRRGDTP